MVLGGAAITDYELFSILMDNLTDCIYFKDVESRFVRINRVMAERFGLTNPAEAIGKSDFDFFSPEHARQAYLDEQQVITTGSPIIHKEVKEIWPNNQEFWVSITKYPWKDNNGDIVGTFGISWDITERKQTEIALQRSEQKIRTIFEAARDGIIVADINGNVTEANSAATQLVGKTIKDIIGANAVQFIHEKDRQHVIDDITETITKGKPLPLTAYKAVNANGELIDIESTNGLLVDAEGNLIALVGVLRDVTASKKAEEDLKRSEEKYRSLVENIDDLIFTLDSEGRFKYVSPSILEVAGYDPEDLIGKEFADFLHPDDYASAIADFHSSVEGNKTHPLVYRGMAKDGTPRNMRISVKFHWKSGQFAGITGILSDVTDIIRATEALKESEERYRMLFENATEAIIVAQDGKLKFCNPRALAITGYSYEEITSMPFLDMVHPDDRQMIAENYQKRIDGQEVPSMYDFRITDKYGNVKWMEINAVAIEWENAPATLNFLNDVTERMEAEEELRLAHDQLQQKHKELVASQEQLLQSAKMAAVGQLVSGIAHEVNNPLMAISGHVEIQLKKTEDEATRKRLQRVYQESNRAISIVQNLLSFARKRESEKIPLSINGVIESVVQLRSYEMSLDDIEINMETSDEIPEIVADFQQLQQVFLNLIINAEQAIKKTNKPGEITIKTEQIGKTVRITVSDNGPGIPEEIRDRVFEPFFTTKGVGEGTGLGLSICYNIVREHKGHMSVQSNQAKGASFIIDLPIAE